MGLAQGAAARAAIRRELERAGVSHSRSRIPTLRGLVAGPLRGRGAGREFFRHFAHQAERLEGVAAAAGVSSDSILDLHLRVRAGGREGGLLSRRTSLRARTIGSGEEKRTVLDRSLPGALAGEADWILRESRPEVGFRSIELGLPWLVPAVAGVNIGGLAVVAGPLLWGNPGRDGGSPSLLLVQECLQRFEDVQGALGWCQKRPVEGEQSFVMADASGAVATVVVSGRVRRVQQGEGELHLEGGELGECGEYGEYGEQSDKGECTTEIERPAERVRLDPLTRRLQLEAGSASIEIGLVD